MTAPAFLTVPDFDGTAACSETDPESWFPENGGASVRAAKAICKGCEVLDDCLTWALANDERHGIWGGLTGRERRQLTGPRPAPRKPADINHGTDGGYRAHSRRGESPCRRCLDEHNRLRAEREARKGRAA